MKKLLSVSITYLVAGLIIAGLTTGLFAEEAAEKKDSKKDELTANVNEAKATFLKQDENLKTQFDKAAGYAIFPSVAKGGVGIGAAMGTGQVFEKDKLVGQANLTQGSIGFQLGGQVYSELIFFEEQKSLDDFKKSNMEFAAQVSAVAAAEGASKNAKYANGVMVFTLAKGGLMFEASVGGQKFSYKDYESKAK
jgi:lipid-binding SYLF domain-containing protein